MKHFGLDWGAFLTGLAPWERLSPAARAVFLDRFAPNLAVKRNALGGTVPALTGSGLAIPAGGAQGDRLKLAEPYLPFLKGLRALGRLPLFEDPSEARLEKYLALHFSRAECAALTSQWLPYGTPRQVAERVSAPDWLEDFRRAPNPLVWESQRAGAFENRFFAEDGVAAALRAVIDGFLDVGGPCTLADLVRDLPDLPRPVLGEALYAGIRYLLLFPSLRPADLTPVVGLWPPLVRRLAQPGALSPAPIEPEETCPPGFALGDLVAILAACTVEAPRLRSSDMTIFARARDTLTALLTPLPEWVEEAFAASRFQRVEQAAWVLSQLGFLEVVRDEERRPHLTATGAGRKWLALPGKARLKSLLDDIKKPSSRPNRGSRFNFLPEDWSLPSTPDFDEAAATVAAFTELPLSTFFGLEAFLSHRSRARNPLAELSRSGRRYYWLPSHPEQLERIWTRRLLTFLHERLLLVGGVQLGRSGGAPCFALTEVGLYLLGAVTDFAYAEDLAADLVVQPNFEVVFLSPSILAEAALSRFAERLGTGVGTLFRITRRSVLAAAATGLTADEALATLRQAASKGVPDNVAREIAGWFGQTRRITVRPAVLVHCPDVEAARRVLAAGGKSVAPLTETVVELMEPKGKAALLRKLREVGVFVGE